MASKVPADAVGASLVSLLDVEFISLWACVCRSTWMSDICKPGQCVWVCKEGVSRDCHWTRLGCVFF